MSEMVDRAARLLCDWVGEEDWTAESEVRYREGARKLIEAMREPTPEMIESGAEVCGTTIPQIWESMIDAALR